MKGAEYKEIVRRNIELRLIAAKFTEVAVEKGYSAQDSIAIGAMAAGKGVM